MTLAHPKMLWLLVITVTLLSLFFWWSWRKRQSLVSQFVRSRLLAHLTVGLSRRVQKTRMILLVVAVGALIFTLAQPQWGFAWEEAHQRGLDIVVAIDTSRSMLAEDIAPNRLQRAKLAALDLMRLARRDRLGLVAFAGTAFLQCPLTLDDEAFRQSLSQLDVGIIPQGGTALAEAIQVAQSAFKQEDNHKILILFTDGEDHDSGAVEAAEKAAGAGLRIFTVGVGTANGELLRQTDEQGHAGYVKDADGNVVKSRLNETLLAQIATAGEGFYLPMSGASTVDILYQRGLAPLPKGDISTKLVKQFKERFQWPLTLAIFLLLLEMFLPDRRRVQRTDAITSASNPELRKLVAALALLLVGWQAAASPAGAQRKYEAGQYKDAYQEYNRLLAKRPDDARLQYNAGAAAYQAKKYDEAAKHFSSAAVAPDLKLQERAYYNLGTSLFRVGEEEPAVDKKTQAWEQSAKQLEAALKLEPKDPDAQYNLEYVKKKLEELKQQQQQQQKQKSDKDQKKDDQKDDQDKQDQKQKDDKKQQDQNKDGKEQNKPEDKNQEQKDGKEQKDQKGEENKQNQPNQADKDKQEEEKKKQEQKDATQSDEAKDSSKDEGDKDQKDAQGNAADSAPAVPGQMTPEQVKQLLDAQKNNEKAMIFLPPEKAKARKRIFKDW